jgi:hypothetical protein
MRLFQNFSFETATTEKCMFRKALPEKLQEPVKTNRVLKPAQIALLFRMTQTVKDKWKPDGKLLTAANTIRFK